VGSFIRVLTHQRVAAEAAAPVAEATVAISRAEGLDGHALSAQVRLDALVPTTHERNTTMRLTGGEVIARTLKSYGVPRIAAIPGHGAWAMLDAFLQPESTIPVVQVFHEQSAVHLADGYWRATGRPMVAMTSIGPGATNTIIGLATAFADSTSVLLITGGPASHMRGHGVMQELDRHRPNAFPELTAQVTKKSYTVNSVEELPFVLHRAFSAMLTGRPGPVHIEVPMDVQAAMADVELHDLAARLPIGAAHPDPTAVAAAADLLAGAERPVLALGGGAISADAAAEIRELAELLGAPVVTTWNGKSAFPEDHELFAGSVGQTGTIPGNAIAAGADVLVAIGCRFTDWSASSYRQGVSFSIPPTQLVHIDVDPQEIGKNYPTAVGIAADARTTTAALVAELSGRRLDHSRRTAHLEELGTLMADWHEKLASRRDSTETPFTSQRPLKDLREVLPRDGFVVVGSGNAQGTVKQSFPVYEPRTHMTSGSYSSMGWAVPAAIGVKLAHPGRKVVCVLGDGDFLQTLQEMAVCVTNDIAVVFLVQNNSGYMSIRGGQRKITDRHVASEFSRPDGSPYSPDYVAVAEGFGLRAWRVDDSDALQDTLRAALDADAPALVEVTTARDAAGPWVPGWWDFPVPGYIDDERQAEYWDGRRQEQHL
jgi:acetolactate synthase-1/2/3 large subunit